MYCHILFKKSTFIKVELEACTLHQTQKQDAVGKISQYPKLTE